MKNIRYVITLFFFLFFINIDVYAGVCEGKVKVGQDCILSKTYEYYASTEHSPSHENKWFNREFKKEVHKVNGTKTVNTGLLGYSYDVKGGSTFSGGYDLDGHKVENAFCIDVGLYAPATTGAKYDKGRELNISSEYDRNLYRVYQKYVNDVGAAKNDKTINYDNVKYKYLAWADVFFRMYTIRGGKSSSGTYVSYAVKGEDIENSYGKKRAESLKGEVYNYITGKSDNISLASDSEDPYNARRWSTWASSKDFAEVKDQFLSLENKANDPNGDLYWENPLKITKQDSCDEDNCTFKFIVDFTNDKYKYFGYGNAYFQYNGIKINGKDPSEVLTSTFTVDSATTIQRYVDGVDQHPADEYEFSITISKTDYEVLQGAGSVDIALDYETYHPMNSENVFINKSSTRTDVQRMVVFTKYVIKGKVSTSGEKLANLECRQDDNKFFYNGVEVGLDTYVSNCKCNSVNPDAINDTTVKDVYEQKCPTIMDISYDGGLKTCDGLYPDNGIGTLSKTVKFNNVSGYDRAGDYSKQVCVETITLDNMISSDYTTMAGKHFGLEEGYKHPKLNANKTCTINVDYNKWYSKYKELLGGTDYYTDGEIDAYNKYLRDYKIDNAKLKSMTPSHCCATCPPGEYYLYEYVYDVYKYNGVSVVVSETIEGEWYYDTCDNSTNKSPTDTDNSRQKFITKKDYLVNHFNILDNTNKHLNSFSSKTEYYNFDSQLRFYYEQEYSNSDIGIKRNDERDAYYNVDDSLFASNLLTGPDAGQSGSYADDSFNKDVDEYPFVDTVGDEPYDEDGITSRKIGTGLKGNGNYSIDRTAIYDYEYKPSVKKYIDSYTAKISAYETSLKNPIELGNAYDTDYSAVAKKNTNYYSFDKLGEKNLIYEHFANEIEPSFEYNDRYYQKNGVQRFCSYETTNELLKTPDLSDSKINIVYRIVDPHQIDPNDRLLDETKGFNNWRGTSGKVVKAKMEQDDTYNPDNLEYSFDLDSSTIRKIREYNEAHKYDDFLLDCNEYGNECKSQFITDAENGTGSFDKSFATNTDGRGMWKELDISGGNVKIGGEPVDVTID